MKKTCPFYSCSRNDGKHGIANSTCHTEKWYLTGLFHDIDIKLIGDDWSRHGIEAQKILAGLLPPQALRAIMVHDRNTGLKPDNKISKSLVFADVIENLSRKIPVEELRQAMRTMNFDDLMQRLPNDAYNLQTIADFIRRWPDIKI